MIYIHKLLPYFVFPITLIIILLIWAVISKKTKPVLIALMFLILTSCPYVSGKLLQYLEFGESRKIPSDIMSADSVVVLSGMIIPIDTLHGIVYEWSDPDRFFGGVELINANKANSIVFTRAKLPWQSYNIKPEGDVLANWAQEFGVPSNRIRLTKAVENTKDEALAVKELLNQKQEKKIILVTSAYHMSRAKMIFEKQGFEVQTYPVDFKVEAYNFSIIDVLPSATAFQQFQFALRELIGRVYYSML